ncbi:hypothetical protein ACJRO7_031487 [Eucalyptus globulus]|uniref:Uncharacterized protein n=1 Tax=Eucalyptus globulus TaxID=34317 RepID=A0ABD3JGL5_EUCGL
MVVEQGTQGSKMEGLQWSFGLLWSTKWEVKEGDAGRWNLQAERGAFGGGRNQRRWSCRFGHRGNWSLLLEGFKVWMCGVDEDGGGAGNARYQDGGSLVEFWVVLVNEMGSQGR